MRAKDLVALRKRLLPELPGFAGKGRMLFIRPVGHTVRGVFLDDSSFDSNLFFAHVFIQPLFIPAKHVGLNCGWRIGGGSHRWDMNDLQLVAKLGAAIKKEALPFLIEIQSPGDVAEAALSLEKPADPYVQQIIAYALARAGKVLKAIAALNQLVRLLDTSIPWQLEMANRAELLRDWLSKDPPQAQRRLEGWEDETARNLGLEDFH